MNVKKVIDDEQLVRVAETLKAVSHPSRLRIIEMLEDGELSVSDVQEGLGITQSLTSQHLSTMRMKGVLKYRKNGNMVYYSIANPDVVKVIHCIRQSNNADNE